ncbi:MAG: hypothetical protein KC931_06190 [Candidatus Omnitrophica bacterium]|nr:hypothetical protein [Candidatus Omnitrophota bacterium]
MKEAKEEVTKLSSQSGEEEFMPLGKEDLDSPDLSGEHEVVVTHFEKKESKNGKVYFSVRGLIPSGVGEGESFFGAVYPGRSLRAFLDLIHVDPSQSEGLKRDDVVGKLVRVRVQESDMDGVGGSKVYEISRFLRQPTSDEPAKELF